MSLIEKLAKLNEDANFSLRLLVPLTIKGFQNLHVIEQQVVEIKNQLVKLNNYVDERGQCIDKQADEALELEATASGSFRQDSLVYERKGNAAMMRSLKHKLASIVVDSDAAENEYLALQEAKTTQRQKITALAREISHERQRIDKEEKAKAAEAEEQKRKRREVERKRQAAEQELRRKATEEAERKRKAEEEAVRKRKATEEEAKRKQLAEEPKKRGRPKRIEVVPKKNQLNFEQNKPRTPVKRRNAPSPTSSVAEMEDDGDVMFLAFKQPAILVPKSPHILPQAGKNNFGTPDNRNVSVSQQNKKPSTWSIPDTPPPRKIPALGSSANKSTSTVTTKNMPPQTPNKTVNKPLQGRQQQQSIVGTPRNHNQPSTSNNNYHAAPAPPPAKKNPDLEKTMDTDYDFSSADDSFWGED